MRLQKSCLKFLVIAHDRVSCIIHLIFIKFVWCRLGIKNFFSKNRSHITKNLAISRKRNWSYFFLIFDWLLAGWFGGRKVAEIYINAAIEDVDMKMRFWIGFHTNFLHGLAYIIYFNIKITTLRASDCAT